MAEPLPDQPARRPYRVIRGAAAGGGVAEPPVTGTPLSALLAGRETLEPAAALRLGVRLGEALEAFHNTGRAHGDLRPEQAIVAPDGAVSLLPPALDAKRAPEYLAPEQLEGQPATERSDIYQLGAVLYRMLTGAVPFDARQSRAATARLRKWRTGSPAVDRIVRQALDRKPDRRQRDASELVNQLWVELSALEDRPPRDFTGRPRKLVGLGSALLVVALVAAWLVHTRPIPTAPRRETAVAPAAAVRIEPREPAPAPASPAAAPLEKAPAKPPAREADTDRPPAAVQRPTPQPAAQAVRSAETEPEPADPGAIIDWLLESAQRR